MSVLFLHIPKTAGQSVHQNLIDRFGADNVCPARDNAVFSTLNAQELSKYQVYSGHVDWNMFDKLDKVDFTFSILRDPIDRLLSYYFYLREQAVIFESRGELEGKHGLKAALYNTPAEFFLDENHEHRDFLDQNFDNFYTYYFAGRSYTARNYLLHQTGPGKIFPHADALVDLAVYNINNNLDSLYWITDWREGLKSDLNARQLGEFDDGTVKDYQVNKGKTQNTDRMDLLKDLGADDLVVNRIHEMCALDYVLLEKIGFGKSSATSGSGAEIRLVA